MSPFCDFHSTCIIFLSYLVAEPPISKMVCLAQGHNPSNGYETQALDFESNATTADSSTVSLWATVKDAT